MITGGVFFGFMALMAVLVAALYAISRIRNSPILSNLALLLMLGLLVLGLFVASSGKVI